HHFNRGRCGLKALVAGLDARAVQRLLQGFASEHAKAVGNARLLLRLADAAGHFVVDSLVVGSFAAQQAAQRHNGVCTTGVGNGARRGGNLPRAGNANNFNIAAIGAAAHEHVERTLKQPIGDHGVPARDDNCELHSRSRKIAFERDGLAFHRVCPRPETEAEAGFGLDVEDARFPVSFRDGREAAEQRVAGLVWSCMGAQPSFSHLVNGIERCDLDEEIGGRGKAAIDEFQIAERGHERCAARTLFLPSLAGGKAESPEKAAQPFVSFRVAGRTQNRNALDHELILAELAGLAPATTGLTTAGPGGILPPRGPAMRWTILFSLFALLAVSAASNACAQRRGGGRSGFARGGYGFSRSRGVSTYGFGY